MELINQNAKRMMEECKKRAKGHGLNFGHDPQGQERLWESLEYIATNQDLIHLSPKIMIPTLYDFWMDSIQVIQGKKEYAVYPHNPYETVINTSPAISFYNDNNPDWLNVMIFYHVIGHIDFFRNNRLFEKTWSDDFCAQALSDKRTLEMLRLEMGEERRRVDYVIEFARSIDNLVAFYPELDNQEGLMRPKMSRLDFYFGPFLQEQAGYSQDKYLKEIERLNQAIRQYGEKRGEAVFLIDPVFRNKYPEFHDKYAKFVKAREEAPRVRDLMQHIMEHSEFLNKPANKWMKTVMEIVRRTSLIFQPQIRTKIINEGWASYWHDGLFRADERISGNEVNYARLNAGVTSIPRVGINPYAIGLKLLEFIEEMADKGKLSLEYQRLSGIRDRNLFDQKTGRGKEFLFKARENFSDFTLINFLTPADFQEFCTRNKLFVVGVRINQERMTKEYYIKSKNGEDYRQMLLNSLYHPPFVTLPPDKNQNGNLYLDHAFEGRMLISSYVPEVLWKLEYLWGSPVNLETTEFTLDPGERYKKQMDPDYEIKYQTKRMLYHKKEGKYIKRPI